MMPQAIAAMSLKIDDAVDSGALRYRGVLVSNTLILGLLILLFATIGPGTPVWLIVLQVFCFGFFTSLQYTSMNTLVYADVDEEQTSSASSIASTMQQMSISFGVATASLATVFFIPDRSRSNPEQVHSRHPSAFFVLGGLTCLDDRFRELRSTERGLSEPAEGGAADGRVDCSACPMALLGGDGDFGLLHLHGNFAATSAHPLPEVE